MIIPYDADEWVSEITTNTCEYHKRQPWDVAWAGCTCSSAYTTRRATPEERAENIKRRKDEEERRRKHIEDYDAGRLR